MKALTCQIPYCYAHLLAMCVKIHLLLCSAVASTFIAEVRAPTVGPRGFLPVATEVGQSLPVLPVVWVRSNAALAPPMEPRSTAWVPFHALRTWSLRVVVLAVRTGGWRGLTRACDPGACYRGRGILSTLQGGSGSPR